MELTKIKSSRQRPLGLTLPSGSASMLCALVLNLVEQGHIAIKHKVQSLGCWLFCYDSCPPPFETTEEFFCQNWYNIAYTIWFFFWQETVIFLIAFQPLLQKSLSKTISLEPAVVGLKSPHPLLLGIGSTCRLQGWWERDFFNICQTWQSQYAVGYSC